MALGVRPTVFTWGFGQRKQSDVLTPVAASNLNRSLAYRNFEPAMMEKGIHSDRQYYGKGHDFASRVDVLTERIRFGRTMDATSQALAWALSLLMGKVTTTGADPYEHKLEWQDSGTNKECLYSSILEKAGNEYQKLISGVFVESVGITAEPAQNLQIATVLSGRKQVANTDTIPAITPDIVFRTNHARFTFGPTGSEVAQAEEVVRWTLNLGQNPDVRWVPGQTSGEEKLLRYALLGAQTVSGSITFFLNNTLRNLFLDHKQCGITITNKGVNDVDEEFVVKIPAFQITAEQLPEGGATTELMLEFNEDSVIKDTAQANSPIVIELKNRIATLLN